MESILASWSSPTINGLAHAHSSLDTDDSITSGSISYPQPIRSPTLYDTRVGSSAGIGFDSSKGNKLGSTRSQLAENLLRDIEHGRDSQYPQSDLLNEDYVNLELFQDLVTFDIGETPPLSPELSYVNDKLYETPEPSPIFINDEFPEETFNQLNAEFQQILAECQLPEGNFDMDMDAGAMNLIENIMDMKEMVEENGGGDDDRSISSNEDNDQEIKEEIQEHEEFIIPDEPMEYIISSDVNTLTPAPEDPEDVQAEVSVKILDALLDGNLAAANSYLPKPKSYEVVYKPIQILTLVPASSTPKVQASTSKKSTSPSTTTKKAPKTNQKKPRLPPKVDRVQRKKEQNKTAATRYREKKKIIASLVNEEEDKLSAENARLTEQKNDLSKQISIVKQLLREVMNAKKSNNFGILRKVK